MEGNFDINQFKYLAEKFYLLNMPDMWNEYPDYFYGAFDLLTETAPGKHYSERRKYTALYLRDTHPSLPIIDEEEQ